jgi:hypothetical protein
VLRFVLVAAVVLASAASARADATTPRIVVHGRTAKATSEIALQHLEGVDSALVRVDAGYVLTLGQVEGTKLGTVVADKLSGALVVAPAGTPACDGVAHAAVWTAALTDGTQTVATLILAADSTPAQLLVCLAGTQLASVKLLLTRAALAPPAKAEQARWEALFSLTGGEPVTSVATLGLPVKLTLRGAYDRRKHQIALSGILLEAGAAPPARRRIVVLTGKTQARLSPIGATGTRPDGSWRGTITNARATLYVQAQAIVSDADTTGSGCTSLVFAAPCVSATAAGYTVTTAIARIQVP